MTAPDAPDAAPTGTEPGATSNPRGDGPVDLGDRVSGDPASSPDTNQGKTEPMPPTAGHGDVSDPASGVGAATVAGSDPQGVNPAGLPPRAPLAAGPPAPGSTPPERDAAGDDAGGFLPGSGAAAPGTSETSGAVTGARTPAAPTAPPE